MVKDIIQIGNKKLIEKSIDIDNPTSKETKELAKDVIDTYIANIEQAAGLSAVQIGVLKRLFVVKDVNSEDKKDYIVMINPVITNKSITKSIEWEGCMSISSNNLRLYGPVERSREVTVEYTDLNGNKNTLEASDFFSHLIQHEMDHLNGVLFLKYVNEPKNIWNEEELDEYLDKYGKFPPIR